MIAASFLKKFDGEQIRLIHHHGVIQQIQAVRGLGGDVSSPHHPYPGGQVEGREFQGRRVAQQAEVDTTVIVGR